MEAEETTTTTEVAGTFCELCSDGDTDEKASTYCTDCQQRFCSRCARKHSSHKASKQHKLIDIEEMQTLLDSSIEEFCESCLNIEESNPARMYCVECDEKLCEECSRLHGKMKMTKSHSRISIEEFKKMQQSVKVLCMQCNENGEQTEAIQYCPVCKEDLCLECTKIHKRFKSTKQHELVDIQSKQTELTMNKEEFERTCEPCKVLRKENVASDVCRECEEFLCEICARSHKMQKAMKMHHLIKVENVPQEYCEPCMLKGEHVRASRLCNQCEELLCSSCSEMHASLKATMSHNLGDIPLNIPDLHSCNPCKVSGREVNAVHHCAECEEYYCSTCGDLHGRQKATLSHILIKVTEMSKPKRDRDYKGDEIGSDDQNSEFEKPQQKSCLQQNMMPGTPIAQKVQSDSLTLTWQKPAYLEDKKESQYQIRYKEEANPKWSFYPENPDRACVKIKGLKSKCSYVFQVRSIAEDVEGPYSSESEAITTTQSLASRLLSYTEKVKEGRPSIHHILSTEIQGARNNTAKTRKFEIGKQSISNVKEKTILLVGATGSGKSTLVDGIINYVAGVNWKDPYRFTLIDLESDEENKTQALSQTEWVTCYTIHPEDGSRLNYTLNIIDTPGFGDTRGLARDQQIVDQLRELFSSEGRKGVVFIDAVCFLMKAPDARLTSVQKYIFMSILSLFGKDIEDNICTLITFADGKKPPVLSAMTEAKLPVKFWYVFNNSGLFEENEDDSSSLAPMFWEMGNDSFQKFFASLENMTTKSLRQTKQVLEKRKQLEVTIANLQPEVDAGLNKLHQLKQEIDILKKHEREIADNKDFEYEVDETIQKKTELLKGVHVTNCLICNRTCHDNCVFANDEDKRRCCVMDGQGNCTVCDSNCSWQQHHNTPYVFTFVTKKVKKTYAEKLKLYQKAGEQKITHEQLIEGMRDELEELKDSVQEKMADVNECNNILKSIALHPNPLSMVEHIELMIESEKMEKKDGFMERIAVLESYRQRAQIDKQVVKFEENYATTTGSGQNPNRQYVKKNKHSKGWAFLRFFKSS